MKLTPERLSRMKPVKVLDIMEGGTGNFHDDGLFSTSIFGRVGSDDRDSRFSYIDIRTPIFHPFLYKNLIKLKGLYRAIMSGKGFAIWDAKIKDFVQSDELNGKTGFHFFVSHWKEIEFKATGSNVRDVRVEMIERYKDNSMTDKILVLPAGLRDVQIQADGRFKENEINDFYRRLISLSNTIGRDGNSPIIDTARYSLQLAFNALYEYMEMLVSGKDKFIQKKWASRRVFNGTRNVISSMDTSPTEIGAINAIGPNDTVIGLYQTMKGVLPKVKYHIRHGVAAKVFNTVDGNARLINPKTLKSESVKVKPETVDRWMSNDGIEKVINAYSDPNMRSRPVMVEDRYMALIYLGPDMTFKIFFDIDELPQQLSREHVYPISYVELLYLSDYNGWYEYGVFITRYPVTGEESIYPSRSYVKTTIVGEVRMELDDNWERKGEGFIAREFPSRSHPIHLDSLVPHPSRLKGLNADFDGDTASANFVYTENSIKEVEAHLKTKKAYIDPRGGLRASAVTDTVGLVIRNMTGD
jgi:hypothetical protein